jgi:hypothetical protein
MKWLAGIRRPFITKAIIAVLAFILGFFAHSIWIRRDRIIDVLNHWYLYYQD